MPFETFDLGRVLQTAEAIKGMRQQSTTDALRDQYLKSQITNTQQAGVLAGNQEARAAADQKAQEEMRLARTQHAVSKFIMNASDPVAATQQLAPEFITDYDAHHGQGSFAQLNANQVRQAAAGINAKSAAVAGITAKAHWLDTGGQLQAVDEATGAPLSGVAPVTKTAAPRNAPTSFDEFTLSQRDPAFASFLKSRKGKGVSMTMPDGTVVQIGGEGGAVGPSELTKPTQNNLQETIVNSSSRLDRLNQLMESYKPDYLRAKGLVKAGSSELKDFLGMNVGEEDKKFLRGYSEFKASASQEFSATLKELSGTAASDREVERVIKGVPSDQDKSPEVFEAKARATTKFITRAIMRANWALKNGIGVQSVDELAKVMPLTGIDQVYQARANEIWEEMGHTPETRAQAMQRANQEFGVAR